MNCQLHASSPDRRYFINLVGGGAVLAATAPLAACASGAINDATKAWQPSAAEQDVRRYMLAHALLAPNPHNRQPWLADLSVPNQITLVCDGDRLLPETDPFGRQILFGCGAFIELAVIAAHQRSVSVSVKAFPDGEPRLDALPGGVRVATLVLGPTGSAKIDPLFTQIHRRHTNKSAYANDRQLPAELLGAWGDTAARFGLRQGLVAGAEAMGPIRRLTRESYEIEVTTPRTWLESARLLRIGPNAIATHRDGISITDRMPRLLHALGLFDPMEVPVRGNSNFNRVMDRWAPSETGSGYLWLATSDRGRQGQLQAGRAYVRMHLQATAAGVDLHPLSQALQEFDEVRTQYLALHRALGVDPSQGAVQMLARAGYALAPTGPSPRRELATMVRA